MEIAALMDQNPEGSASPSRHAHAVQRRPITAWSLEAIPSPAGLPAGVPAPLASGAVIPAAVPGCVHTDLMPHGFVGDVAVDGSEEADAWVLRTAWRYTTRIETGDLVGDPSAEGAGGARAVLRFEGIDTCGTVVVNGRERLTVSDMHRVHELDVTHEVASGALDLRVDLMPAVETAEAAEAVNPLPRPEPYVIPYNQVRKMACSYGWDWGPITGTAGLWKPVVLEVWRPARLRGVRVEARPGDPATVEVIADIEHDPQDPAPVTVRVEVTGPDGVRADAREGFAASAPQASGASVQFPVRVEVPGARTWQPVGHGEQPLYDVVVTLQDAAGEVIDTATRRVGFRSVAVVQEDDAHGRSFELHVNGQRLWVRGLNWIPDDPFPSRLTRDRLRHRIQEAVGTGTNLLRVWGGGIFESDDFFELCDELGVLVWQDFLFACAAYPEDDATVADVRAEVADNVARLRHHPSLVVWSGCNENLWGFEEWDWQPALAGRPWGARYYAEVLPEVLAELGDDRPYVPGSPFSPGGQPERSDGPGAADESRGTVHIWDVWNTEDYELYEAKFPRFAAEFGYQAPASWPTLARAVGAHDLGPGALQAEDPRLAVHQKAHLGEAKLRAGLQRHFPELPGDGPGWYYATQLTQARAVRVGIGHLRSLHETCSGTIWWQHNDMWPVISWSILDSAGRRKLAWYAMRQAYRARDVVVGPSVNGPGGALLVTAVNDTDNAWTPELTVAAHRADGSVVARTTHTLDVAARGGARVGLAEVLGSLPPDAVLVSVDHPAGDDVHDHGHLHGTTRRSTRWLTPDLDLDLPLPALEITAVAAGADEVAVTVGTNGLVRDLCLLAELAVPDAVVSDQVLTLLPGESATFRVRGPGAGSLPSERWSSLLWHDARLR